MSIFQPNCYLEAQMRLVSLGHNLEKITRFEDLILKKIMPIVTDVLRFGSLGAVLAVNNSQVARKWVVQRGLNPNYFSFKAWFCFQVVYVVAVVALTLSYGLVLKKLFPICQLIYKVQRARELSPVEHETHLGLFAGCALRFLSVGDASKYVPFFKDQFTLTERSIMCVGLYSLLDRLDVVDKYEKVDSYFLEPFKSDLSESVKIKEDKTLLPEFYKDQVLDVLGAVYNFGLIKNVEEAKEIKILPEYRALCIELLTDPQLKECKGGYFKTLEDCGKLFDINCILTGAAENPNRIMHSILEEILNCDSSEIPIVLLPDLYKYIFEYDPKSFTKPGLQCTDQLKKEENLALLKMPTDKAYTKDDLDQARRAKLRENIRNEELIQQFNIAYDYLLGMLDSSVMVTYNFEKLRQNFLDYIRFHKDRIVENNSWSDMPYNVAMIINEGVPYMEQLD